jgi:hypothetical protein
MAIAKIIPGIPVDILTRNKRLIENLIETKGLVKMQAAAPVMKAKEAESDDFYLLCGGNWAHIHWNGDIYNFTEKAWAEFSQEVMKDFSTRLAKAGSVSMNQVNVMGKAMNAGQIR